MSPLILRWLETSLASATYVDSGSLSDGGSTFFLYANDAGQRLEFFFKYDMGGDVQYLALRYSGPEGSAEETLVRGSDDESAAFTFLEAYIKKLCGHDTLDLFRAGNRWYETQRPSALKASVSRYRQVYRPGRESNASDEQVMEILAAGAEEFRQQTELRPWTPSEKEAMALVAEMDRLRAAGTADQSNDLRGE